MKLERPQFDAAMLDALAQKIGKEIFEWASEEPDLDEVIEDTKRILKRHHSDNGYEIAREFDGAGYCPDAYLVEILEGVYSEKYDLLRIATIDWVKRENIKPEFLIGTSITFRSALKMKEGIITGYREETAEYLVCIPSDGHTLEGSTRAIIKYESATLAIIPTE